MQKAVSILRTAMVVLKNNIWTIIDGIKLSGVELMGAIVTEIQAISLARILGLVIK